MAVDLIGADAFIAPAPDLGGDPCTNISTLPNTGSGDCNARSNCECADQGCACTCNFKRSSMQVDRWILPPNEGSYHELLILFDWSIRQTGNSSCSTSSMPLGTAEYSIDEGSTWTLFDGWPKVMPPEGTETSNGFSGSPNPIPMDFSIAAIASSAWASSSAG